MIRAVLFDLDETLIDRTETMRRFLLGQHLRFTDLHSCTDEEYTEACLRYQQNGYADKLTAFTSACIDLGFSSSRLVTEIFEDFKDHYGKEPVLFAGARDTLNMLSQYYRIGLVSNGRTKGQTAKIEASGIAKYFSSICISESVGCKKPDHAIFMTCLRELSVSPSEAVFVGDNPEADIEPAKLLGMRAVWLKNEHFPEPAFCDGVIMSIEELPNMLSKIA
ncbi:MAG: HAD family hydrolase [Pseudohongiellaceae bacterium]|nr:HAD family hydrolase [Pseudohongiellaceae bacterium]